MKIHEIIQHSYYQDGKLHLSEKGKKIFGDVNMEEVERDYEDYLRKKDYSST